jgi:hypothetical protein
MSATATLSNGRTVKENGGGKVVVLAVQNNFEVVLEIWKCMQSTKTVVSLICNGPSNTINNFMHL